MKGLIGALLFFSSAILAGDSPLYSFRWGDNTCSLIFDDTNLTTEVKSAISDDVGLIFSRIPTNIPTYAITNDVRYTGAFDGINGALYYPTGFRFGTYKTIGATNYYYIREPVSLRYMQAIALTNHHQAAIAAVPVFLEQLENMRPGVTTTNEYVQHFWSMREERVFTASDFSEHPEWITEWITTAKDIFFFRPSLLAFSERSVGQNTYLCFSTYMMSRTDRSKYKGMPCIYAQGAWRFFNPLE